jgi:methylisocitrate lyase
MGRRDNGVSLEQALSHIRAIAAGVDVPVNADFEGGFAVEPEKLAANFTKATATGVAGLSIEDSTGSPSRPLFDFGLAVERVRAARRASSWVARIWPSVSTRPGSAARPRSPRWSKRWRPTVNVLVGSDFATVAELAEAGVRRISVGGALARAAWTGFLRP